MVLVSYILYSLVLVASLFVKLEFSILLLRRLLRQRHSQLQVWRVEIQGLQLSKAASLMQSSLATDGRVSQSEEAAQLVDQ